MKMIKTDELLSLGEDELLEIHIKSKKITVGYLSATKSFIITSAYYAKALLNYLINHQENEKIDRNPNTISIFNLRHMEH